MKLSTRKTLTTTASFLLLFVFAAIASRSVYGSTCSEGVGVPPFLGGNVNINQNVLLMLDNSASMLDLAAVGAKAICYEGPEDTPYDSTATYSGYFRPFIKDGDINILKDTWYFYNIAEGRFEEVQDSDGDGYNKQESLVECGDASGTMYQNDDVCITMNGVGDPPVYSITAFAARGNFLNWAAGSKLDIQKKVLTGGKYDETNSELIMESRGCLDQPYVKKVAVQNGNNTMYLTLGIRPPDEWKSGTMYPKYSVVRYPPDCRKNNDCKGYYYIGEGDLLSDINPTVDTVNWKERDYNDLTQIEMFKVTDTGANLSACAAAIENLASENPQFGTCADCLKGQISTCLEGFGEPTSLEAASNSAYTQALQDCWTITKHPENWNWMAETETLSKENMNNIENDCRIVYERLHEVGLTPNDIEPTDNAFVCFGNNSPQQGYVGRCWDTGVTCTQTSCDNETPLQANERCLGGILQYCTGNMVGQNKDVCNKVWLDRLDCPVGNAEVQPFWDSDYSNEPAGGSNERNGCIQQALEDYCGSFSTYEVIDPSDQEGSVSGEYYNLPAILMGTATENQLGKPLLTMNGRIFQGSAPSGVLEDFKQDFRFGAMAFNKRGELTECEQYLALPPDLQNQNLLKDCNNKLDGAQVISYISGSSDTHMNQLVKAINDIKGDAWTPLAEAMYTAIGYYTQDTTMRLNLSDFLTQSEADTANPQPWLHGQPYIVGKMVTYNGQTYFANSAGTSHLDSDDSPSDPCRGPEKDTLLWTKVTLPTGTADPVEDGVTCQTNNVILITEGASTVDINPQVKDFAKQNSNDYSDMDDSDNCGQFQGSTYLDDLTWYGWQGGMWDKFANSDTPYKADYSNVRTWVVESATRHSDSNDECDPNTLLTEAAANGAPLKNSGNVADVLEAAGEELKFHAQLKKAFESILERVSSGSASSVISASRSGEGALYQAIFWPATDSGLTDADGEKIFVKWTGQVHAFLVDRDGNLREDTNKNGALDAADEKIIVFYDTTVNRTMACNGTLDADGGCLGTIKELNQINYMWNVADWLNNPQFEKEDFALAPFITKNRSETGETQQFTAGDDGVDNTPHRYIFTWNDLDNDGVVDKGSEVLPFVSNLGPGNAAEWLTSAATVSNGRAPVSVDFGVDPTDGDAAEQVNRIINWVRGQDQDGMRSREMFVDTNADDIPDTPIYWKLGDVIYSTPITVAQPAENYNQLYRDKTYGEFVSKWARRRHVVYFGGNDGMLHAVNSGFFTDTTSQFCRALDADGKQCAASAANTPVLGEELWAYVPYNLLPHLSCLTDPFYEHKYYVDLRPRVFDVRIFTAESACTGVDSDGNPVSTPQNPGCIHPQGWGTILVGGMRFGGAKMKPSDYNGDGVVDFSDDNREFTSAYFILDITNPEKLPTLLGETTSTLSAEDLDDDHHLDVTEDIDGDGHLDVAEDIDGNNKLDAGEDIDGDGHLDVAEDIDEDGHLDVDEDTNNNGVLDGEINLGYTTVIPTIVPMNDGSNPTEWALILGSGPTSIDGTSDQAARLAIIPLQDRMKPGSLKSLRIPTALPADSGADKDFGTIEIPDADSFISDLISVDFETQPHYMADVVYFGTVSGGWTDGDPPDGWGGKLYRLVTNKEDTNEEQVISRPHEWIGLADTNPNVLYDPGQPIVTAPTVGTDGLDFWVYFGTGRFLYSKDDKDDKIDVGSIALQTFYGIREPIDCLDHPGKMNWKTVTNEVPIFPPVFGDIRGDIGLLPVEKIAIQQVEFASPSTPGVVGCYKPDGSFDPDLVPCFLSNNLPVPDLEDPLRTTASFDSLLHYIVGPVNAHCAVDYSPGFDGWSKDLLHSGERNLGQATLLGGLLSFTSYIPNTDKCSPEGSGYLYGIYYQTGTSWYEDVFGRTPALFGSPIQEGIFLGAGLSTTPNIHVGAQRGSKAFIQTSVGQIVEIPQPNLPIKQYKGGMIKWRDILENE